MTRPARRIPIYNFTTFPPCQKNPINNFTVKGPMAKLEVNTWPLRSTHRGCVLSEGHHPHPARSLSLESRTSQAPGHFTEQLHLVMPGQCVTKDGHSQGLLALPVFSPWTSLGAAAQFQALSSSEGAPCPGYPSRQRPSRREQLGRALAIAELCYGIPVGVLMLHALG